MKQDVTDKNVEEMAKGGRARWKVQNETFDKLKNQGYQFEHNFAHGRKNLSAVLAQFSIAIDTNECIWCYMPLFPAINQLKFPEQF